MKLAASNTLKRAGVGVALATALLSATGCGYIYSQPTTIHYAASDGVNADVADIDFRNIMVIAESEEADGRVLGTVINESDEDAEVGFDFGSGVKTLKVPAHESVRLESDDHKIIISPAGADAGMTLENVKLSVGAQSGSVNVPVLDGTLDEYEPFLPNAASSDASHATATPSATPTASPSATTAH